MIGSADSSKAFGAPVETLQSAVEDPNTNKEDENMDEEEEDDDDEEDQHQHHLIASKSECEWLQIVSGAAAVMQGGIVIGHNKFSIIKMTCPTSGSSLQTGKWLDAGCDMTICMFM